MIIQVNFPNKVIVYNKEQMMHRVNECFCGSKNDEQIGTFCLFKQFGNDDDGGGGTTHVKSCSS